MSNPIKIPAEPRPVPLFVGEDEDCDDSFVVLGSSNSDSGSPLQQHMSSLLSDKLQELQDAISRDLETVQAAGTPVNGSGSLESSAEIQRQIEELAKENFSLKNRIAQINVSMKTQHDRIVEWKADIEDTYNACKFKLKDAKATVDNLRKDNALLLVDVEKYRLLKTLQDEEIMKLKEEMRAPGSAPVGVVAEPQTGNDEKIAELEKQLAEMQSLVRKHEEEKTSITQKYQEEVANLRDRICQQDAELSTVYKGQSNDWEEQKILYTSKIEELSNNLKTVYKDKGDLVKSCQLLQMEIQHHSETITKLKETLAEKERTLHKAETDLYNQSMGMNQIQEQLRNSQITITAMEDEFVKKNKAIEELRKLLQESKYDEENDLLRQQLDVFKEDYNMEKQAKEALNQERNQMVEDLENIHRRNKELQEELELYREQCEYVVARSPSRAEGSPSQPPSQDTNSPKLSRYSCPVCFIQFRSLRLAQEHIEHCLGVPN